MTKSVNGKEDNNEKIAEEFIPLARESLGMKSEPLKDKKLYNHLDSTKIVCYEESCIRSAVEWLKEELWKEFGKPNDEPHSQKVNELIDKAFEDVIKETKAR